MKLNSHLQPENAIPARQQYTPGIQFDALYEVQARRVRASQVVNNQLVQFSGGATGSGTIAASGTTTVTTDLSPTSIYVNQYIQGNPMVAIYEGTAAVGSMQIYPAVGAGISAGKFVCQSGYDYRRWNTTLGTAAVDTFTVTVRSTAGTTANLYVETRWRYVQNNAALAA